MFFSHVYTGLSYSMGTSLLNMQSRVIGNETPWHTWKAISRSYLSLKFSHVIKVLNHHGTAGHVHQKELLINTQELKASWCGIQVSDIVVSQGPTLSSVPELSTAISTGQNWMDSRYKDVITFLYQKTYNLAAFYPNPCV